MKREHFTGTFKLLRLYLRRDRFILLIWVLLSAMVINGQVSFVKSMPDWQFYIEELSNSPLTSALLGPVVPLNMEGAIMWRGLLQASITVMLGAAITVIRHTRTEESTGRNELLLSKPVGPYANLSAALIIAFIGSIISGILVAGLLIGLGFGSAGSILVGLTLAASGLMFAGIGGLCAQIFSQSGAARGAIFGAYGLTMVTMVANNMGGGGTIWAWLAPEAWFRITVPYGDNNYWPIIVFLLISAMPLSLSYRLLDRRDMGSGIVPQKEGRPAAVPWLNSPLAMAWNQHRYKILIWAIAMAYLGGLMGYGTPNISESISETFSQMNTWSLAVAKLGNQESFMAVLIYILGLMGGLSVYGITSVQRMREEEKEDYAEMVLSKPVSRFGWMGSNLVIAFVGSIIILLSLGLASGIGWSIASGDSSHILRVLLMSISKIPSVWAIIGLAALLYGWLPRLGVFLNWLILAGFIFVEMLWEAGIVGWSALKMTPFAYSHYSIPIGEIHVLPLIVLTAIAAALVGLGILGFNRREIGH